MTPNKREAESVIGSSCLCFFCILKAGCVCVAVLIFIRRTKKKAVLGDRVSEEIKKIDKNDQKSDTVYGIDEWLNVFDVLMTENGYLECKMPLVFDMLSL